MNDDIDLLLRDVYDFISDKVKGDELDKRYHKKLKFDLENKYLKKIMGGHELTYFNIILYYKENTIGGNMHVEFVADEKTKDICFTADLHLNMFNFYIQEGSYIKKNEQVLDSLSHEINHLFNFIRTANPAESKFNHSLSGDVFQRITNIDYKFEDYPVYDDFRFLIYLANDTEINARHSGVGSLIKNVNDPKKRLEIIKNSFEYKQAKMLINSDAIDEILGIEEEDDDMKYQNEKFAIDFVNDFIFIVKYSYLFKENRFFKGLRKYVPIIPTLFDIKKILGFASKDTYIKTYAEAKQFLEKWREHFQIQGEKSIRKLLKLVSY